MITIECTRACDLARPVVCETLRQPLFAGDCEAHRFAACVTREGAPVTLAGCEAAGYFIRADGATVLLQGSVENATAAVTLNRACYEVPGCFSLVLRLTSPAGARQTILALQGTVARTSTDAVVDPAQVIPSLDDLLAQIAQLESAADRAAAAAEDAESLCDELRTARDTGAFTGRGLTILGRVAAESDLASVASPQTGDAWAVGDAPPYRIFVYDGLHGTWVDHGTLQSEAITVNGIAPEGGNVALTASDVPLGDGSVASALTAAAARCTPTLLWSGAWSSGTIAVPGIGGWKLLQVTTGVGSALCLANVNVQGLGSAVNAGQHRTVGVRFTVEGDSCTLITAHYVNHADGSAHGALTDTAVTAIYGLIRKEE